MNNFCCLSLLLLCLLTGPASALRAQDKNNRDQSAASATWQKLSPAGAGFSVLVPGKPLVDQEPVDTKVGKLNNLTFTIPAKPAVFMVSYAEFPSAVVDPDRIAKMLDGARDNALAHSKGELKSENRIKLGPNFGREWLVNIPSGVLHARAYWVNNKLYQLAVLAPKSEDSAVNRTEESRIARFFDSFEIH